MLHNLRYDEEVASFANAAGTGIKAELVLPGTFKATGHSPACTKISFRTGNACVRTEWPCHSHQTHVLQRVSAERCPVQIDTVLHAVQATAQP